MGGRQAIAKETKSVNPQRYVASFDVKNTTKGDSGRYRCIAQSERGVGVSSYAELTVKPAAEISGYFPVSSVRSVP
ncbi:hypothetical protein GOODEAATRI_032686, partial [Goodea atripinnis]